MDHAGGILAGGAIKNVSLERLAEFYKSFHLVPLDQAVMDAYCRLWVEMARAGHAADYPDLWIAASAVAREIPILTRNPKAFYERSCIEGNRLRDCLIR